MRATPTPTPHCYQLQRKDGDADTAMKNEEAVPLHAACRHGRVDAVRAALLEDATVATTMVDTVNAAGETPLFVAARFGHAHVVQLLLEHDASVEKGKVGSSSDATPLRIAVTKGHVDVVHALVEANARLDDVDSEAGLTVLYEAARNGHTEVARVLIEYGAKLHVPNRNEQTPLYASARNGHIDMMRLLLEHGDQVDRVNTNNVTPLWIAALKGRLEAVKLLIAHGANVDAADVGGITPLWIAAQEGRTEVVCELLQQGGSNANATSIEGLTALYVAAQNGHTAIVKELVAHGAQVDIADSDGHTPLYIVCRDGYLGIAKVLLANHASVDGSCVIATDGLTPLFVAARNGHTGVVLALLSHQARANVKDPGTGMTPLQVASQRDYTGVLRALATKGGADIEAADDDGDTALHAAARSGSADAMKALTKFGARVDATNVLGESPLYIACGNGHLAVAKALLAKRASATLSTVNGDTPLHAASRNGHITIASELLANYAARDVLNHRKRTPLYEASANGRVAVVNLLLDNGGDRLLATDDGNGDTPLIAASRGGHLSTALALVKAGASIHTANLAGETAALAAGSPGHFEVVRELVKSGASVHVRAAVSGETLLIAAARWGNVGVVSFLIEYGELTRVSQHRQSFSDGTPLLVATLQTLSEYGPQMHEFKTMWDSVVKRLRSVYSVFEQRVTESTSSTSAAVMDQYLMILFRFVRTKLVWEKRNFFTRLVASHNAASIFQDFHTEIDHLERRMCGTMAFQATASQSDWRHQWESDRENLTEIFWDIVSDDDRLSSSLLGHDADALEAILLLLYEINAHSNQCTKRKLGLLEFSIKKLTSHVSSAMAPVKLPKWFLPHHELDLEHLNSHARSQESTHGRSKLFSGKWLNSNVLIRECRLNRDAVAGFGDMWFQLSHPNVIKVYGVYHLREPFLVVFENAPVTSLRAHLVESRGSIAHATPQWIWQKLYEVALGLKYLHDRGIVLGKLQCDNVWIGTGGLAKIAECGLESYDLASVDEPDDLRWVAPERLEGNSPTTASDVYSLGICVIEAFMSASPWQGRTNRKVKSLITWGVLPAQPKQLNKAQWALVNKMCLFDPLKREKLVTIVEHLKHFARASTIAATDDPQTVIAAVERSYQEKSVNIVTAFDLAAHVFPELGSSINAFLAKLERKSDLCHDAREYVARVHARLTNICVWLQQGTNVASEIAVAKFCQVLVSFDHFLGVAVSQDSVVQQAKSRKVSLSNSVLHREIDELMGFLSMDQVDPVHEWNSSGSTGSSFNQTQLRSIAESESDSLQSNRGAQHATDEMVKFVHFESKHMNQKFAPVKTSSFESTDANAGDDNSVEAPPPLWFIPLYDLKFKKEDYLGRGAFGEVYRGAWLSTPVVMKMMGYEDDDTGSTQTMFLHELRVWFPLNHPHVVKLFGACHIGKRFFVCEYAANGTLRNFLTRHGEGGSRDAPSASMPWQTLYEVALGLQYLHDLNIVHNDLKCDNFLVGADGKAKITDFGLSCLSDMTEIQVDLKKLGAQQWKSPEYLRGERSTLASDVYSFGMSILEAVTGTLPWGSMSDAFVRRNVRRGVLPSCPDAMSARQWNLIEMMCANEPSHRLRISTVVERLQELAQHEMAAAATVKEVPLAPHGQRTEVPP